MASSATAQQHRDHAPACSASAAAGQRGLALHWYNRCVQILKDQLGLDPEPETVALAQQIRCAAEGGVSVPCQRLTAN